MHYTYQTPSHRLTGSVNLFVSIFSFELHLFGTYQSKRMSLLFLVFLLLGLSVLVFSPIPVVAHPLCSSSDHRVLQGFYKSVKSFNLSWPNHTNCCLWIGIQCNTYGQVVSIHLPSFNLLGSIPPILSDLSALQALDLSNNSLSGGIPPSIANLSSLTVLDLSYNPLIGWLPSHLPPMLQHLDVSHCMLHGSVPHGIINSSSIKELFINHNFFSSFVPSSSASLAALEVFDASSNFFKGSFPQVLLNCTKLRYLNVEDQVHGRIPSQLGKAMDGETLRLQANGFTGSIPDEIGTLIQLRQLWLDGNALHGVIPETLGKLSMLTVLSLANNRLEGPFPKAVTECASLSFLSLSGNMLSGYIPPALGSLGHLEVLLLNNNRFSGVLPLKKGFLMRLELFDASNNMLDGLILATSIGNGMDSGHALSTFSKKLHQEFVVRDGAQVTSAPKHCWSWQVDKLLEFINVCKGSQKGSMPYLPHNLHVVGSHMNSVSKTSPCFHIRRLGLSSSILQNQIHRYRHLLQHNDHPKHMKPVEIGVIAGLCVFCGIFLLVAVVVVCRVKIMPWRRSRFGNAPKKLPSLRKFRRERSRVFDPTLAASISMRDLYKATDGFAVNRIVGDGGFGLVYCATLSDGKTVAVKKLTTDGMQGEREFEAEMETLGRVKHENLVELLAYCKVGDERVLIYEFVENGSLDTWLHEKDDGPVRLNWEKRVKIARGSARGLSFLHNECNPHVIHRDIKSSNILLRKDFEPQISDFGLARTMSPLVSHVSTDAAGTLGYMAPEYSTTLRATTQVDVYSFGMVMLELASGRRPNSLVQEKSFRTLRRWACHMLQLGYEMDVLDPVFKKKPPPSDQIEVTA
eukprot:c17473_g1_i1 orf=641-3208(+)